MNIVGITGFSVERCQPSGIDTILQTLHRTLPEATIHDCTWDDDLAGLALRLEPPIVVLAHSYGAGVGMPRLARALAARATRIALAALVDPVPRWWTNMGAAALGAILGRAVGTIRLPTNVDRCLYWRQVGGAPYGRVITTTSEIELTKTVQPNGDWLLQSRPFIQGTVYATTSAAARARPWEQVVLLRQPPTHNEIDSYPPVRHAIIDAVMSLS